MSWLNFGGQLVALAFAFTGALLFIRLHEANARRVDQALMEDMEAARRENLRLHREILTHECRTEELAKARAAAEDYRVKLAGALTALAEARAEIRRLHGIQEDED